MDLYNKNIILTGASSGIGLALLEELAPYNCNVIAVARSIDKVDIKHAFVTKYACDIAFPENIDRLFAFSLEKLSSIDIFIANAGFAYYEIIGKPDWDHIAKIYQTNVFSTIYAAQKMKAINPQRPYRMLITASAMSFIPIPGYALYASTKAALHGFVRAYRYELRRDQKFQMIYPISTRTGFFEAAGDGTPVPWPSQTPEEVARAILKGILADRLSIFPSLLFRVINVLNNFVPLVGKFIEVFENFKLKKWQKRAKGVLTKYERA